MMPSELFISLRPRQWVKNLFLFAALLFAGDIGDPRKALLATLGFVAFCCASSALYLVNDLRDVEEDRRHPQKKLRPLAAGTLDPALAKKAAAVLALAALVFGGSLGLYFFLAICAYLLLLLSYSWMLKRFIIIDVIVIALGFVIRAIAGAFAIGVPFSAWLVLTTFFLALFLAIGKRKNELAVLKGRGTRSVLTLYSPALLDQLLVITVPLILMMYTLYTFNSTHSALLIVSLPFVVYGVFRYLSILDTKAKSDDGPTDDLFTDQPLMLTVLLWLCLVTAIILMLR